MSKPYVKKPSNLRLRVPRTLESDFDAFLQNDIPDVVMDFELLTDWFDQYAQGYKPKYIRAQIYPDSSKSRYMDTDNNLNFRASKSSGIKKGDMVIDPSGNAYVFDWDIAPESNNSSTRALKCNCMLTFKRLSDGVYDDLGMRMFPSGWRTIASDIPCNAYRYDGRPQYSNVKNQPGVVPNALTILSVQMNEQTDKINIDDIFTWGTEQYVIIDIDRVGLNLHGTNGVLRFHAKKRAGGNYD